jgi:peptidoglycan/xylan/chitin deacetylase (PgdA/CDA1 family)
MIKNPIKWPNGARCAVAITFDIDTDSILHIAYPDRADTMVSSDSWLKYDEIAVPRILDLFREFALKQTFFYPAWCMERYPHLVDLIMKEGHEIAHHGYLHEHPNELSRDKEIYWTQRALETIRRMTGRKPRGYRAPLYNFSKHTADILSQEGFLYDASLMGDDIPYVLETRHGRLIELPSHWALDDWPHFVHNAEFGFQMPIKAPDEAMKVFMSEFEAAWEYGGLWIAVWHPFVTGRLARCHAIKKMIEAMLAKGKVWFAPMEEIAAHVKKSIDEGDYVPRVDRLPYYDGRIAELAKAV